MCNICGKNCGKGGALKTHIQGAHQVDYDAYKKCFYGDAKTYIANEWNDSVSTSDDKPVIIHVLVRRFIGDRSWRRVAQSAKPRTA